MSEIHLTTFVLRQFSTKNLYYIPSQQGSMSSLCQMSNTGSWEPLVFIMNMTAYIFVDISNTVVCHTINSQGTSTNLHLWHSCLASEILFLGQYHSQVNKFIVVCGVISILEFKGRNIFSWPKSKKKCSYTPAHKV